MDTMRRFASAVRVMGVAIGTATKPEGVTVRYIIDSKVSSFTVKAFVAGLLSAFGHSPTIVIPDFSGEVNLNLDAVEQSSLRLVIQSVSLNVTDDISEKDRKEITRKMQEEGLECDAYPEIVYECTQGAGSKTGDGQYSVTLNGQLTLHGVTRNQPLSARVSVTGDLLRAAGEFSVNMSDYEIPPVSAAGGTVKLKDELKLSFNVSARKQA